jgi:hypothetical protein
VPNRQSDDDDRRRAAAEFCCVMEKMAENVTTLPPRDPIFALAPELKLHLSEIDGALVVNSREVARVFFHRKHRRVLRKIMWDIWQDPMQPNYEDEYRQRADGTVDITSLGLTSVLCHWGFGHRNKRVKEFQHRLVQLVTARAKQIKAETGRNLIVEGIKKFFPGVRMGYVTEDGFRQCCDDCQQPLPAGPALHDELWTSIAQPDAFLCFVCFEKRLGRPLTQADLKTCAFNAGWISFDGADVAAMQFARGRRLLPP